MNSISPVGRMSRITIGADASVIFCCGVAALRSMTPAFANGFVFCRLVTRAVIWTWRCAYSSTGTPGQSQKNDCVTKWKLSDIPQMSAPAPLTVNVPAAQEADPATPVDPMSSFPDHGPGSVPHGEPSMIATLSKVAVFKMEGSWLQTTTPAVTHPSPAFMPTQSGTVLPTSVQFRP